MTTLHFLALQGVPPERLAVKLRELAYELHVTAYGPVRDALGTLYHLANNGPMRDPSHGRPSNWDRACTVADIKEARDAFDRALMDYEFARGPIDALLERADELNPPTEPKQEEEP
jgi:hypothetical protein